MSSRVMLALFVVVPLVASCAASCPKAEPRPLMLTGAELVTREGRVEGWTTTLNGDMDGVLLSGGARVHFPRHTGHAIRPLVKAGKTVRASGWEVTGPDGTVLEATRITGWPNGPTIEIAAVPIPSRMR